MSNYNPKSLKAEEFISHEEILETIEYAEKNKHNVELIDQILNKARPQKTEHGVHCEGLTHREASVLLACDIPEKVEELEEHFTEFTIFVKMTQELVTQENTDQKRQFAWEKEC